MTMKKLKNYDIQVIRGYACQEQQQTVELIFQQDGSTVKMLEKVGGNCTGLDVIECAITNAAENWPHVNEDGDAYFPLGKCLGDKYEDGDWFDSDNIEDELQRRIVSARIVAVDFNESKGETK